MIFRPLPSPALLAVLPALILGSPALAQVAAAPPTAASTIAQPAAEDPVEALGRYLRVLASFPNNLDALTGAGRSALAIGDTSAAISFFSRAEKIAPQDGRIKAGLASALVQMEQPQTALRLFNEAVSLGVPEAQVAGDRGLARDLVGDTKRAQDDYQLALRSRPDDETTRRLAVSQAISGDRVAAMATLDPLLRRQDRAAWRVRAFALALTGDRKGAEETVLQLMPRPQAQAMTPFFSRLASLSPGQKAAAVNLGQLPSDGRTASGNATLFAQAEIAARPTPQPASRATSRPADASLVPSGAPLGGAAAVAQATSPGARLRALSPADRMALTTEPAGGPAAPPPTRYETSTGTAGGTEASGFSTRTSTVTLTRQDTQPLTTATATPRPALTMAPTPSPAPAFSPSQPAAAPVPSAAVSPTTTPAAVASPRPEQLAQLSPAGATASSAISPVAAPAATAQPLPAASTLQPLQGPSAAGAPIRAVDLPASTTAVTAAVPANPPAVPMSAPAASPAAAPTPAPASRTTETVRASVPAERPAARVTRPAAPAREVLAAKDEKPAVPKAVEPEPKAASAKDGKGKASIDAKKQLAATDAKVSKTKEDAKSKGASAKDSKTASAKDKADAKTAKAEDKSKDARGKDAKGAKTADKAGKAEDKAAGGERYWVQVASGSNKADLGKAWAQTMAKAPKLLSGRTTWTTPWKQSNRLMVGPFKSEGEAQSFVNQLGKEGAGAMQITTRGNAKVEKLQVN